MSDDFGPGADTPAEDEPVDEDAPKVERVDAVGDRPEADVLEQAMVVRAEQDVRAPTRRDDVPEADAGEQAIEEPLDEEDRG